MWKTKLAFLFRRKYKALVIFYIFICLSAFFCLTGVWKVRGIIHLLGKDMDADIDIEIHVWKGKPAVVYSRNLDNPEEIVHVFHVYQPTEEQVNMLSKIPHTHFYASRFEPVVSMQTKLKNLIAVTSLPFVKYVVVFPSGPATIFTLDYLLNK